MKKYIFTLLLALTLVQVNASKKEYYKAMGEALSGFSSCKSIDDFQNLANRFERIATTESAEWLPLYYHAQCYILMSFMEPADAKKKDAYIDAAEKSIAKLTEAEPNNSEVLTLQAFAYTARLVVNPMERGQKYSMLSAQTLGMALAADPANPRAKLLKIQNEMGTAQFFGSDVSVYCDQAKSLLENWDSFKPASALHPTWGKDQVQAIVDSCNKK